ncbi:MAG: FAD-dependent monooxygenase [Verrucomicrobia bacterium]|nr:FAD-dependent monooxygenase [Verrucomicrobiota bacterium]MCH8511484.1 FAD-dependent monooxygenase [Kiritimatiellia bacterium]
MITIVGAGPVGLVLACLLGKQGRAVTLYEKRVALPAASMAIGITPPSLDILEKIDLKAEFLHRGLLIPRAQVFESGKPCGTVDFRDSENEILSLPQFGTLKLLRQRLSKLKNVHLCEGVEMTPERLRTCKGWIIACDGADSSLRRHCGIPMRRHEYGVSFVMADFEDKEDLGDEARLYFSPRGAVESFPLPGGKRRWIVQRTQNAPPTLETLLQRVQAAAGFDLAGRAHGNLYPFTPQRTLAKSFFHQQIILCGDAAHTMSPIGGQGMNTGFADAFLLSRILPDPSPQALQAYTRERQRAFRIAARRAAQGMWLGTRTGIPASRTRALLLKTALHQPRVRETLARTFAMRNLPQPRTP